MWSYWVSKKRALMSVGVSWFVLIFNTGLQWRIWVCWTLGAPTTLRWGGAGSFRGYWLAGIEVMALWWASEGNHDECRVASSCTRNCWYPRASHGMCCPHPEIRLHTLFQSFSQFRGLAPIMNFEFPGLIRHSLKKPERTLIWIYVS